MGFARKRTCKLSTMRARLFPNKRTPVYPCLLATPVLSSIKTAAPAIRRSPPGTRERAWILILNNKSSFEASYIIKPSIRNRKCAIKCTAKKSRPKNKKPETRLWADVYRSRAWAKWKKKNHRVSFSQRGTSHNLLDTYRSACWLLGNIPRYMLHVPHSKRFSNLP